MASGIFAILDDIAALLDDVAVMSKVSAKKTAGILGDDLAVNAEKASGFASSREIPVLWAITKGSILNKLIILPFAFLLSAFLPWVILIILLLGGVYLAYEGVEKIYEFLFPHAHAKEVLVDGFVSKDDILAFEKKRVKSAIMTDFILSVEIIIIALGTVAGKEIVSQIIVVTFISLLATVGVYGIVALIVRMDEVGYKLIGRSKKEGSFNQRFGLILVNALPKIIRCLTVIGTIALLLVSGGIFVHNLDFFHNLLPSVPTSVTELLVGIGVGFLTLLIFMGLKKIWSLFHRNKLDVSK
jgi:predicted DNA repair protein MutK